MHFFFVFSSEVDSKMLKFGFGCEVSQYVPKKKSR